MYLDASLPLQGGDAPEQEWGKYASCVDLIGCGKEKHESQEWIVWLQQLIEQGQKEGMLLLGVTKGSESFQNSAVNVSGDVK